MTPTATSHLCHELTRLSSSPLLPVWLRTPARYVAFRPVFRFMKDSPLKVLLVFGIAVLSYESVSFVVQAMLGLNGDPFGGPVRGGNGGF